MPRYRFKKLDAFSRGDSAGNPAGAVYLQLDEQISDAQMQRIARELKGFVSEVAFVRRSAGGGIALRYFSCIREVAFCGHATIAVLYDVLGSDPELRQRKAVFVDTPVGRLEVFNMIAAEDAVYITAPPPQHHPCTATPPDAAAALRTGVENIAADPPPALVNAGLNVLLIPLTTLEAVLAVQPDLETLRDYCLAMGADVAMVFTPDVHNPAHRYRTRVFAATFGYLEDPATGVGNAALGYYLLRRNRWDGAPITIEQGPERVHANLVRLRTAMDDQGLQRVLFGGSATVRIEGEYLL